MNFKNKVGSKFLATMLIAGGVFSSLTVVSNAGQPVESVDNNQIKNIEMVQPRLDGQDKQFIVRGITFTNFTTITTSGKYASGSTTIVANKNVAANQIGAHCNLYNAATGKVVKTADWKYNSSSTSSLKNTTPQINQAGKYFTRGTTRAWDGNAYYTTSAYESPKLTAKSMNLEISEKELEERQYLYENKNMIAAVGINDIDGYVSIDDLMGETPKSNEEVKVLMASRKNRSFRTIPLYDTDGETIIGSYRIDF